MLSILDGWISSTSPAHDGSTDAPQSAHLVGFDDIPGLIRFLRGAEVLYVGMESVSIAHFRRFVTKGGTGRKHGGGQRIWANQHDLNLEYAILREDIERVRDALIAKLEPEYNFVQP